MSFTYQWKPAKNAARQWSAMSIENGMCPCLHASGVLCVEPHTAPLERYEVHNVAINILLRWNKEGFCFVHGVLIGNLSGGPISYINSRLKKLFKL